MGSRGTRIWARSAHPECLPGGSLVTFCPYRKSLAPQGEPLQSGAPSRRAPQASIPASKPRRGSGIPHPASPGAAPTPFGLRPSPYPFCPFGTFPPERGNRPPDRGSRPFTRGPGQEGHTPGWLLSAFGRFTFSPSPTRRKRTFLVCVGEAFGPPAGIRTGSVGSANPGAEAKPHRRQFLQTQGPVARRKFRVSLRFCAPEMRYNLSGGRPS